MSIKLNPFNTIDMPSGPLEIHVRTTLFRQVPLYISSLFLACDASSCSSGKVAGLIFFETFSFVWTSQVIGNVSLATLAGGPYGSWYYFGPRELGEMVCTIFIFSPIYPD
jgi:hypothetical protein